MKIKGLIIVVISILIVFLIYLSTIDNKVYYLALGDYLVSNEKENYSKLIQNSLEKQNKLEIAITDFQKDDNRITDIINQIQNNQKIKINGKDKTIKNALIKADMVLLSVGSNDLFYKLDNHPVLTESLYDRVDVLVEDTEKLFELLREYCKEDIFFTGYYNPYDGEYDELIEYANTKLKKIAQKYEVNFVDIKSCIFGNINRVEVKLNKEENLCVAKKLQNRMKEDLFEHKVEY